MISAMKNYPPHGVIFYMKFLHNPNCVFMEISFPIVYLQVHVQQKPITIDNWSRVSLLWFGAQPNKHILSHSHHHKLHDSDPTRPDLGPDLAQDTSPVILRLDPRHESSNT